MDAEPKLAPCPWCKSTRIIFDVRDESVCLCCHKCSACGPLITYKYGDAIAQVAAKAKARAGWNRRTPSAREQRLADTITWAFNELLGRDDIHTKFVRDRLRAALATDREGDT